MRWELLNYNDEYIQSKSKEFHTDKLITVTLQDYEIASMKFSCNIYHTHGVGANSKTYFPLPQEEKEHLRHEMGYLEDEPLLLCTGELNSNKNQQLIQ